ncbi:MAG: hypothetical protein AAGA18_00045 [Verrucomicrobiota bacterium]
MLSRIFLCVTGFLFLQVFCSCATTSGDEEERVSTLPWNKPQGWEGKGPAGSIIGGAGGLGNPVY